MKKSKPLERGSILIFRNIPAIVWERPEHYPCRPCPFRGEICAEVGGVCAKFCNYEISSGEFGLRDLLRKI